MASENNPTPDGEREEEASLVPGSSDENGQVEVTDSDMSVSSDALDEMPPDDRSIITRTMSSFAAQFIAPVVNAIFEKFTSDHISTIINNAENERIRESEADNSRRKYQFAYFLIGLLAIIGLGIICLTSRCLQHAHKFCYNASKVSARRRSWQADRARHIDRVSRSLKP